MEDQNCLPCVVAADGRPRLGQTLTQKQVFDSAGRVDVDGTTNVSSSVLIVEATVNDVVVIDFVVVASVQEFVNLESEVKRHESKRRTRTTYSLD